MAEHPNATLYRKAIDAFAAGDLDAFTSLLAPDIVWHTIGGPTYHSLDEMMESMSGMETGEFEVDIHDVVANDEHVVGLVEARVKYGDQEFAYRTAEIAHVKDGKFTERWAFSDDTEAIIEFFRQFED